MIHNGDSLFARAMGGQLVALRMTERGILVDESKFAGHLQTFEHNAKLARRRLRRVARKHGIERLNPNAAKQVHALFFGCLNVKATKRTEEGKPSLDEEVIRRLAIHQNPDIAFAARALGAYRRWMALRKYVRVAPRDCVYHVNWRVNEARTGRWSSSPNLQNIPKAKKLSLGGKEITTPTLRDIFISRPGFTLVEGDYNQLELRVIALLSGDKPLIEAYARGEDVHTINARGLFPHFDKLSKDEQKAHRDLAKRFAYAVNYGSDPTELWKRLSVDFPGLTLATIERMYETWFTQHRAIYIWMQKQIAFARANGYVECPADGRRQTYPRKNQHEFAIDVNEVLNFPVQAYGAALIDAAFIRIDKRIDWKNDALLLQVHDAAIGESKKPKRFAQILREEMPGEGHFNGHTMKFPVDIKVGKRWSEMEEIKEERKAA